MLAGFQVFVGATNRVLKRPNALENVLLLRNHVNAPGLALAFNLSIMGELEKATWALGINLVAAYFFVRLWRLDSVLTAQAERERQAQSSAIGV